MISLQNLHVDSKTNIFLNTFKSYCSKFIVWWMFEQISTDIYCLRVSAANGSVQLGER